MDILGVSRLMIRRWLVSVPLLLLTGAATALTALNVRPDYIGTAHVSLLPPIAQHTAAAGQTLRVNPWDTERLSHAVVVRLNTGSLADQLEAEGFTGKWDASLDEKYRSVIRIEVTSPTEEQARSTSDRLVSEVDDEVVRQQARYPDLGPDDKITSTWLDAGENVAASTANLWRAVVVVAVIGLLLAAAASFTADAVLGRRERRRSGIAGGRHLPPSPARQPAHHGPAGVSVTISPGPDAEATQPVVRITNVPLQVPITPAVPHVRGPEPPASNGGSPAPDDSTIVLPLSNAPWAERQTGNAGHGTTGTSDKTADAAQR